MSDLNEQDAALSSDLVELTATFMTNRIWKGIYVTAVKAHQNGKAKSVLDAFCTGLGVYRQSLAAQPTRQVNHLGSTLSSLYEYCKNYLKLDCTYMGFIDDCARFILPAEEYQKSSTTHERKILVVRTVFLRTVERFIAYILQNAATVCEHNANVELMTKYKEEYVRLYHAERMQFFGKLTAIASGIRSGGNDTGTISRELIEKLQTEIKTLLVERANMQDQTNKLVQYAMALKTLLLEKEQLIDQMEKMQKLQQQVNRRPATTHAPMILQPIQQMQPVQPPPQPSQNVTHQLVVHPHQNQNPHHQTQNHQSPMVRNTPKNKPSLPTISTAPSLPIIEDGEPDTLETVGLDDLDEELTADA